MEMRGQLHALAALLLRRGPWYPPDRRLGRSQSQSGCSGKQKKIPAPGKNQTLVIQPIALSLQ